MNHLVDIVESEIQLVPAKEMRVKRDLSELEVEIKDAQIERDDWISLSEGSGSDLLKQYKKELKATKKKMKKMEDEDTWMDHEYGILNTTAILYEEEITLLEEETKKVHKTVSDLKSARTKKNKIMEDFRKARKTDDDSLYTKIDEILHSYGILRASYHGGDLTGGCILNLMLYADEIMAEVAVLLAKEKSTECKMTEQNIWDLCMNVSTLLIRWDGALSILHQVDPEEKHYVMAQERIDKALELSRSMGFSITPKYHGAEMHLVWQMRRCKGGLMEFDESWTEQYHQTGYNFDMKLRNMGSEKRKAEVRAAQDRRANRPQTIEARAKLKMHKTGKREGTKIKEALQKRLKESRREEALTR